MSGRPATAPDGRRPCDAAGGNHAVRARAAHPDTAALAAGLAAAFGVARGGVTVLRRTPNPWASTYAAEFVHCRLPDGRRLELLCKYAEDDDDGCHGHRGNAAYEAAVYRLLMQRQHEGVPFFHGAFAERAARRTWLILERLRGARVDEHPEAPRAVRAAAAWAGRLHRANLAARRSAGHAGPTRLAGPPAADTGGGARLMRRTRRYYGGWVRRTIEFARPLHARYRWLPALGRHADRLAAPLLAAPQVFIHGELCPHNVLCEGDAVYAVDWQSAALGAGELDLAALTERWPADIAAECERAYCRARWPDGAPASFAAALDAARLHWHFRWLGDRPEWTLAERSLWRWQELERALARLGLA